jgi:hypothetical protein
MTSRAASLATLLAVAAGGALAAAAVVSALLPRRRRLQHIVSLRFKDTADGVQIATLEAGFRALERAIPEVKALSWGHNTSREGRSRGLTHVFVLEFDSPSAVEAYLVHPAHTQFVEQLLPHLADVLVVDFTPHQG